DVRTSLTLPEGITASSATQSGGTCTIEGAELVCVRPTLEAGETSFGTIVLTAAQAGLATFRVQTSGSYVDPVGTNDSAEVSIEVVPTPAPSTAQRDTRDGGGGGSSGCCSPSSAYWDCGVDGPKRPKLAHVSVRRGTVSRARPLFALMRRI